MIIQKLILKKGWNLVSFNLYNIDLNKIIQDKRIIEIRTTNENYNSEVPDIFNNLKSLDPKLGYYVKSSDDFDLEYSGFNYNIQELELEKVEEIVESYKLLLDDKVNSLFDSENNMIIKLEGRIKQYFDTIIWKYRFNSDKSILYFSPDTTTLTNTKSRTDLFRSTKKYLKYQKISGNEYLYKSTPEANLQLKSAYTGEWKIVPDAKITFTGKYSAIFKTLERLDGLFLKGEVEFNSEKRREEEFQEKLKLEQNKLVDYLTKKYNTELDNISTANFSNSDIINVDLIYQLINMDTIIFFNTGVYKINLSKNLKLKTISCSGTLLKKLDLSANKNIENIYSVNNKEIEEINLCNINKNQILNFNCTNCPKLNVIYLDDIDNIPSNWKKDKHTRYELC